ncbi:MAG: lipopolysaccharide biosynthesis protein [Bacillota bacterium]
MSEILPNVAPPATAVAAPAAEVPRDAAPGIAGGAAWMVLFKLAERSIGVVSTLILARLLTPADFGLVAMAMSVVALTELMGAFGFETSLIQRQNARRAHYDTAWTFNVLFGTGTALLIFALASPAARFYGDVRLQWILPALAIGAFAQGFENIGTVAFRKELKFRDEFRFLLAKKLASFVVTIGLALSFHSYWALVAGIVTGKLFAVWLSYRMHPFRPRMSLQASAELFHFSKWLFISNLVLFLQNKSADFILGRTAGARELGTYNIAIELAMLPSTELIAPLNRAVFPVYSRLSGELHELRRKFLEVFGMIALIAFPISTGLACVASPAVHVLLGTQWEAAVPLLRIFSIAGLVSALQSNLHLVIVAMGKPKANTFVSASTMLTSLPIFIVASLHYGAIGAAWVFAVFAFVGLCTIHFVFFRITAVRWSAYLSRVWRPAMSSICMAGAIIFMERYMGRFAGALGELVKLASLVTVGALSYTATVVATWMLAGRPQGAEHTIIVLLFIRLRRFVLRGKQA